MLRPGTAKNATLEIRQSTNVVGGLQTIAAEGISLYIDAAQCSQPHASGHLSIGLVVDTWLESSTGTAR